MFTTHLYNYTIYTIGISSPTLVTEVTNTTLSVSRWLLL